MTKPRPQVQVLQVPSLPLALLLRDAKDHSGREASEDRKGVSGSLPHLDK